MTAEVQAVSLKSGDVVSYQGDASDGKKVLGLVSGEPDRFTGHIYVNLFKQFDGGCIVVPASELKLEGPFAVGDYAIYSGSQVEFTSLVYVAGPLGEDGTHWVQVHDTYGGGSCRVTPDELEKLGSVDNWTHEEAKKRLTSHLEWIASAPEVRYI